jgi:hypothetical protein
MQKVIDAVLQAALALEESWDELNDAGLSDEFLDLKLAHLHQLQDCLEEAQRRALEARKEIEGE